MPICPVCRQEVGTRILDGQTVLQAHFRPGAAPPCPGSNQRILELLAAGPQPTGTLAPQVGISRQLVYHHLLDLELAGQVKRVGKHQYLRWALASWKGPTPRTRSTFGEYDATVVTRPKGKTETESWWTKHAAPDAGYESFSAELAARRRDPAVAHNLTVPRVP